MSKLIYKNSKHIRWNWEQSPDNLELVRYHFIIVDDKYRSEILSRILNQLKRISSLEFIRAEEGKVKGSKLRYLFTTYDSRASPSIINWDLVRKTIKKDSELRERKKGTIEDYVSNLYG